jgi:hypothetical protein
VAVEWLRWEKLARSRDTPPDVKGGFALAIWDIEPDPFTKAIGSLPVDTGKGIEEILFFEPRGVLHLIDTAARMLAVKYSWSREGAVLFLCCGRNPTYKLGKVEYDIRSTEPKALSRIHLSLDPTLSPDSVKALYSYAKNKVLPIHRALSPKQMAVANDVFSQTNRDTSDDSAAWRDLMEKWNTWVPLNQIETQRGGTAEYGNVAKFRDQARSARDALLNPNIMAPDSIVEYPPASSFVVQRRLRRGQGGSRSGGLGGPDH